MKYIKSLLALIFAISIPVTAFAADAVPANPIDKIAWAIKFSGSMPKPMVIGFIFLTGMIIITILISIMKGDETNE